MKGEIEQTTWRREDDVRNTSGQKMEDDVRKRADQQTENDEKEGRLEDGG